MDDNSEPSLGRLLIEATRAHRAVFAAELDKLGLHVGQELVLIEVGRDDGLTQAVLTRRLGVERATVSRALTRLQRAGFLVRDKQGASAHIRLTPKGKRTLPAVQSLWQRIDQQLVGTAGTDLDAIRSGLGRILDQLKTAAKTETA